MNNGFVIKQNLLLVHQMILPFYILIRLIVVKFHMYQRFIALVDMAVQFMLVMVLLVENTEKDVKMKDFYKNLLSKPLAL
jgi:hypothetical protein